MSLRTPGDSVFFCELRSKRFHSTFSLLQINLCDGRSANYNSSMYKIQTFESWLIPAQISPRLHLGWDCIISNSDSMIWHSLIGSHTLCFLYLPRSIYVRFPNILAQQEISHNYETATDSKRSRLKNITRPWQKYLQNHYSFATP